MTDTILLVYCSCPDRETAEAIATALVERRLAACVNIGGDSTSVYRWEGRLERATETMLSIKSSSRVYPALERALVALHPYELPEIVAVPVQQGLPGYLQWVEQCLTPES
ncbi:MAG TPA: divalent-cation tolerance protein CutA [Sedimenticola thiotaurini]|uniref:Divalent-cation tolerance protein CutA n=1 Tax=Sedimenticola thiotaurini TaxID=1543721 RepID=A0A831WAQ6_9GAMM|nr:divalent-cation tolerance protein CutA [Sedimenticola thiotaurini]